jgi:competence ComEA-like helix-hairpin-helix protein
VDIDPASSPRLKSPVADPLEFGEFTSTQARRLDMDAMRWIGAVVLAAACVLAWDGAAGAEGKGRKADRININQATKAELMTLAGVGPGLADRIITHREAHGPFKRAEDLEKVEGVGKAVLQKNVDRIVVR